MLSTFFCCRPIKTLHEVQFCKKWSAIWFYFEYVLVYFYFLLIICFYFVIRFEISLNMIIWIFFLMITVRDCISPQVFGHYRLFPSHLLLLVCKMDSLYQIHSKMLHSTKVIIFMLWHLRKICIPHEGSMV